MGLNVCVIGAGVAGLTAANACAEQGFPVTVIERNPYPGGRAASYGCKATDECVQCGVCLIRDALDKYSKQSSIKQFLSTSIESVRRNTDGSFNVDIERHGNPIDPGTCVNCGTCVAACEQGSIRRIPGWGYYVDDRCNACGECVDSCDFGALSLDRPSERATIQASDVIIASGFEPYEPGQNRKWGYGQTPRIITGTELEKLFHEELFVPAPLADELGESDKRVAFVQCVGSRNVAEGIGLCSRVCCAYALRMANRLGAEFPQLGIDFFYMDLQYFGKNYEAFMEETCGRISLVRSNPISVSTHNGRPVVRFDSMPSGATEERIYDLVVLSHGMCPPNSNSTLARDFGLSLSAEGFLSAGLLDPAGSEGASVHLCGAAAGPKGIAESVEQALQVAAAVAARSRETARRAG